jgi:hypothetical protein
MKSQRLIELARALALLSDRVEAEAGDPVFAAAVRLKFGGALGDIQTTCEAVRTRRGQWGADQEGLAPLEAALSRLHMVILSLPTSVEGFPAPSREVMRRSRQRVERLESSTRRILQKVSVMLAVGLAATGLSALPAAAGTINVSGAVNSSNNSVSVDTVLNVFGLTQNVAPGSGGAISLVGSGNSGAASGAAHYTCSAAGECDIASTTKPDGTPGPDTCTVHSGSSATCIVNTASAGPTGSSGPNLTTNVTTGGFSVTPGAGSGAFGVVSRSTGGNGGNGGDTYVAGDGGDGGDGIDGGTVQVNVTGHVATLGDSATGVAAFSNGGNGGNGGASYGIAGSGGDGGKAGFGGAATANLLGGSVSTAGLNAYGVVAVSQGGNGGKGGGGGGLVFSPGGGDTAGAGGTASVSTAAGTSITTTGDGAHGIVAQSLGGAGGGSSGGFGLAYSGGGSGGTGGNGGDVSVFAHGTVTTQGDKAQGILAQSIGGGGGDAGTSVGLVALGASGGPGGKGGSVAVVNTGAVTTHGAASHAIEAQSIGGGGGNGSSSFGAVALGGDGSGTTTGGNVSVANSGHLSTSGAESSGVFAQSIGGGGGDGGHSGGLFSAGGKGGSGANAGTVTVTNSGNIDAGLNGHTALNSYGVFAQSVGGGGGNGGGAVAAGLGFSMAMGGSGGVGGDGSSVTVGLDNANIALATGSTINTHGDESAGIFAQSVGGGGGNGGFAIAGATGPISVSIGTGGAGAGAGNAGFVNVVSKGAINTSGLNSDGIFAQSVGGSGGSGGFAITVSGGTVAGAFSLGGGGGAGGAAGSASSTSQTNIVTQGANASGIVVESVGGGGGNGGFAVSGAVGGAGLNLGIGGSGANGGVASTAEVTSSGYIITLGDNAQGILATSVGGGGGNGGFSANASISAFASASVSLGGTGGGGQSADAVTVNADGGGQNITVGGHGSGWTLYTAGDNSQGILAQSVGGGGGNGGFAGSLALSGGASVGVSLGGGGSSAGDASTVRVNSGLNSAHQNILTTGDSSAGILAQSVGGGGGNGGFAVALSGSIPVLGVSGAASVALGGHGGAGGAADEARADSIGNIATFGEQSDGILVQSVGGGGGNGGFVISGAFTGGQGGAAVALGGTGAAGNTGGAAVLNSLGNIETHGKQSVGLLSQSVGGGGGNGGFSAAVSLSVSSGVSASVGIGGGAGSGGDAGSASLVSHGSITTYGDEATGIITQSVGGGGGNGGSTVALAVGALGGASVSLGRSGGDGGDGGEVNLSSSGDVTTGAGYVSGPRGGNAIGILAQSVGGGGGNGGFAGSLSVGGVAAVGVSLGGAGGGGGDGGDVDFSGSGTVRTAFNNSDGILAQSVGGGGGNGGFAISIAGSGAIEQAGGAAAVSIGGRGGGGGDGAGVTALYQGNVYTSGDHSSGFVAQSVGGGGGNGGFSIAGAFTVGVAGVGVGLGGSGNSGGKGGDVTMTSTGDSSLIAGHLATVITAGYQSTGVLAQSVGGGGGNGGFSGAGGASLQGVGIGVAIGGSGAAGGTGGVVGLTSTNNVLTTGNESIGVLGQSVGGGGGNGGFTIAASGGKVASASFGLGGSGGAGRDAGAVTVTNTGNVVTSGVRSYGVVSQSVGGGGGNGGFAVSGAFTIGKAGIAIGLGGAGGVGGDGKLAKLTQNGDVATSGDMAFGVMAQSVGGGGGNGGFSGALAINPDGAAIGFSMGGKGQTGGDGGAVDLKYNGGGLVTTSGASAIGVLAQSVGGGGGVGGFAASVGASNGIDITAAIGGNAGVGGDAGQADMNATVNVFTTGVQSHGVMAQSVGGGGGVGSFAIAGALSADGKAIGFSMGSDGGAGGKGGKVNLTHSGWVEVDGEGSVGVLAQSVGGGGGDGGWSFSLSASAKDVSANAGIGGKAGGAGQSADDVTLVNTGQVETFGDNGVGVMAQSVGGGGGEGHFGVSLAGGKGFQWGLATGGAGGTGATAGTVTLTQTGNVYTDGDLAHGVLAQSIGGGGGNGGFAVSATGGSGATLNLAVGGTGGAASSGGNVKATLRGNITTQGAGADGLIAQSIGGGGGNGGFSGSLAASTAGKGALSVGVGGNGGIGGAAGGVIVDAQGAITTHGSKAVGLVAQSLGGGGGNGGGTVSLAGAAQNAVAVAVGGQGAQGGTAGTVNVKDVGDISTAGNQAYGLLAQSVGGGGGDGGFALSGALSVEANDITASVGGFGGSGNWSSNVDVDYSGTIHTTGLDAHGLFAQSVGGGGGTGGFAGSVGISLDDGKSIALSMGGFGGSGGAAADVTVVTHTGAIYTEGDGSYGILAQSIGGGGGNGGFAFSVDGGIGVKGMSLAAALGGFGGTGNNGGDVTVTNGEIIATTGVHAAGIYTQSIGGGGGNGGFSAAGVLSKGAGAKQASVSVGGFGGTGADSGDVKVTNTGHITTYDQKSDGVFAQSIGGGGGDGGLAFSGMAAGNDAKQISVSVGGFGGEAGDSGKVDVTNGGSISTFGVESFGIYAQSVGGGGGRGGFGIVAGLSVADEGTNVNAGVNVGGSGGAGGISDQVNVANTGSIITRGAGADGIFAQSVGGGGGVGGGAFTALVAISTSNPTTAKNRDINTAVTIGGSGGTGNNAGGVLVNNSGRIDTFGADAAGIYAQSIGGGGGAGGSVNAMSIILGKPCKPTLPGGGGTCDDNQKTPRNFSLNVIVGGSGGGASHGNVVNITNTGTIVTRGANSDGVFAQSVGGGGGVGGNGTLGSGDYLDSIPAYASLGFIPFDQTKLYTDASVVVGGSAGSSGSGALVKVVNSGGIATYGASSRGIMAQSIGGGGGIGGTGVIGALGTVGIGGSGGASGDGGEVNVTNTGSIFTDGNLSQGIFAQSVGGGGGIGGSVDRALAGGLQIGFLTVGNYGVTPAFGGKGGGGGDGGNVTVVNTGSITTHGYGSVGILAQSVGGGGGILGDIGNFNSAFGLSFVGSVGDAGKAGNVIVTQTGDITTTGGASAIFAQSVGGQGKGGDVTVTYGGRILVVGKFDAVIAQSTGLGGGGKVTVNMLPGTWVTAGTGSNAVHFYDGTSNSLTNKGRLDTADGINGMTIGASGAGDDSVNNQGVVLGSVDLGLGANAFDNKQGAFFYSGTRVLLGAGNLLTNSGYESPGGDGLVMTSTVTGNFLQTASGNYANDLDLKQTGKPGEADRITVLGSATVGGKVTVSPLNKAWATPFDHAVTIVSATGGQTHAGLTLVAPVSAIAKFDLRYPDANTIQLGYTIDFSPTGLNRNQTSVGDHINSIQLNGGTDAFRTITGPLFDVPDNAHLAAIYDRLTQEPYVDAVAGLANAGRRFTDNQFSCIAPAGSLSVMDAPSCAWVRADGRDTLVKPTGQTLGWRESGRSMQFGYEAPVGANLRLGFSFSDEETKMKVGSNYADLDGSRLHIGAVAKTRVGGWDAALAVSGGKSDYDSRRQVNFPAFSVIAQGEFHGRYVMADARVSRLWGGSDGWIRPGLEVLGGQVHSDAATETGAGPLNLHVAAADNSFLRIKPSVEIGRDVVSGDTVFRPYLSLGVSTRLSGENWAVNAAFDGAPPGATPFQITAPGDRTLGEVSLGLNVVGSGRLSAKFGYTAVVGGTTRQESVGAKIVLSF